jgi:hypothetical protein
MNTNRFFWDSHCMSHEIWKSCQTTYVPLWEQMKGAWLWTQVQQKDSTVQYIYSTEHVTDTYVTFILRPLPPHSALSPQQQQSRKKILTVEYFINPFCLRISCQYPCFEYFNFSLLFISYLWRGADWPPIVLKAKKSKSYFMSKI